MSGSVIRFRANVQVDDRTETLRLTGSEIKELKPKKVTSNNAVQLTLWVARHDQSDLNKIKAILSNHPGKTPVEIHLQSGAGKRATVALHEKYCVKKSESLDKDLALWLT